MALDLVVADAASIPEAVKSLYVERDGKFHLDVNGVEDVSGLKKAIVTEREGRAKAEKDSKAAIAALEARFAGIDPEKVRGLMSKFENDTEANLIAAGKIDEVINGRTEKMRRELAKEVEAAGQQTAAERARADKFSQRVLDNHIRQAALASGLHKNAVEDALYQARTLFTLDANGDPVQLDANGSVVISKDGKTPFSPGEWLEGKKETSPHWFPAGNAGGGAPGNKSSAGDKKTITRAEWDTLPANERVAVLKDRKLVD